MKHHLKLCSIVICDDILKVYDPPKKKKVVFLRGNLKLLVMRISAIAKLKKSTLNEAIPDELVVFTGFLDLKNKSIDIEKTIGIGTEKLFYSKKNPPFSVAPSQTCLSSTPCHPSHCVCYGQVKVDGGNCIIYNLIVL